MASHLASSLDVFTPTGRASMTSDSCAGNFRGTQPLRRHLLQGTEAGSNSGAHRPESLRLVKDVYLYPLIQGPPGVVRMLTREQAQALPRRGADRGAGVAGMDARIHALEQQVRELMSASMPANTASKLLEDQLAKNATAAAFHRWVPEAPQEPAEKSARPSGGQPGHDSLRALRPFASGPAARMSDPTLRGGLPYRTCVLGDFFAARCECRAARTARPTDQGADRSLIRGPARWPYFSYELPRAAPTGLDRLPAMSVEKPTKT